MVTWRLIEESDDRLVYEYSPEGKEDRNPGIITIDRLAEKITLTRLAEDDFETHMEEVDTVYGFYYSKAIKKIADEYNKGIIKKSGISAWY